MLEGMDATSGYSGFTDRNGVSLAPPLTVGGGRSPWEAPSGEARRAPVAATNAANIPSANIPSAYVPAPPAPPAEQARTEPAAPPASPGEHVDR
jgi:hypothetical protein